MEMSMNVTSPMKEENKMQGKETDDSAKETTTFLDPNFVSELLGSVNVEVNDPLIQAALSQLGNANQNSANESDKSEGGDDNTGKKRKNEET
jgi:hypothetical protein